MISRGAGWKWSCINHQLRSIGLQEAIKPEQKIRLTPCELQEPRAGWEQSRFNDSSANFLRVRYKLKKSLIQPLQEVLDMKKGWNRISHLFISVYYLTFTSSLPRTVVYVQNLLVRERGPRVMHVTRLMAPAETSRHFLTNSTTEFVSWAELFTHWNILFTGFIWDVHWWTGLDRKG